MLQTIIELIVRDLRVTMKTIFILNSQYNILEVTKTALLMETHRRPTGLIGDSTETDMPHQRIIGDRNS